jgi:hypothetical protein
MGLVSQSVKNLKGGISQQPDILRFANQGAIQINGWSSESDGLQKRPPTTFVKHLGLENLWGAKPLIHMINRDKAEQYLVVFDGTSIQVRDLNGNPYAVTGALTYVQTLNPREDLRLVTVADYTFVVNRTKVVTTTSALTHPGYSASKRALINVRGGQYGRTLRVVINGIAAATLVMPDGSVASHVTQTDAQTIANSLATQIRTAMGAGWTAVAGPGHVLVETSVAAGITQLSTSDGYADQLINAFTYQVQTFNKLPTQAPEGYLVEITGESSRSGDNYWVRYHALDHVWRETYAPNIILGLNNTTMPHALVRQPDGSFTFAPIIWGKREVGDDETNPFPSFVDATINEVFFFRNRLGFLTGENAVMSRASKYFDFFPGSVAALSDDDPIDVAVSHNRVSILKYAVPFSEQLLLWSDQAQFVLSAEGVLSASTLQLDLTTEFDVSDQARPFGIGRGVYYVSPRASYSSIKRYFAVQDVRNVKSAEDISAHVPKYVPSGVFSLHGTDTENFLAVLSDNSPSTVFIYKYLYVDENLVQQSWGHWDMGEGVTVMSATCIGSYMWLVLKRPGGLTLERIQFTVDTVDFNSEMYRSYMDMKKEFTPTVYNDDLFGTLVRLKDIYGFTPTRGDFFVIGSDGNFNYFPEPVGGWTGDGDIWVNGNITGVPCTVGCKFQFVYGFSKLLIKQTADDGSSTTEDTGRLQLRRAWVNYSDSGAFEVVVDNGSTPYSYTMSGGRLGQTRNGALSLSTGQFKFPVAGNALHQEVFIFSDAPVPLNIIGSGWEGNYLRRSSGL